MLISELELLVVGDRIIGSVFGVVVTDVDIITWDGKVKPLVNVIAALSLHGMVRSDH